MPYLFIHFKRSVQLERVVDGDSDREEVYIDGNKAPTNEPGKENISAATIAKDRTREYYSEFFKKPFKNFIVLSGAGTSIGVGGKGKVGLSMHELWEEAKNSFTEDKFAALCNEVRHNPNDPNLEKLLTNIEGHITYSNYDKAKIDLKKYRDDLLELIKQRCDVQAPEDSNKFPHFIFLSKITQRKVTMPRVKVFTLNYDLLFEQAATAMSAVALDGFSFTTPRNFSGRLFDYDIVQREKSRLKDEDNFISRLFHLYKLHGSLNWTRVDNNKIQIQEKTKTPLLIFPRESKYENSYEQPFFEMMSRFHQNLRLDNTLLLCIGYSFRDRHINVSIREAYEQNPGLQLGIVNPVFDLTNDDFKFYEEAAKTRERVIMISEKFDDFATYFPEIQTYGHGPDFPDMYSNVNKDQSI